jgi:hypothetical protein
MDTELLATTFVELADSLVDEYDVIELLQLLSERCVELLGVDAAGLELDDPQGVPQPVAATGLTDDREFETVHALSLRLRGETIGALRLFWAQASEVRPDDLRVAQALADVATIAILQERLSRSRELLAGQLQAALDSRIVIEQAKGVLAERAGLDVADAFTLLRRTARSSGRRMSELAAEIVAGDNDLGG